MVVEGGGKVVVIVGTSQGLPAALVDANWNCIYPQSALLAVKRKKLPHVVG